MSDELRVAAERLLKQNYEDWRCGDVTAVACAYLAEHPADEGEPVTEEWLRTVGFTRPQAPAAYRAMSLGEWHNGFYPLFLESRSRHQPIEWQFYCGPFLVIGSPTRGHVRRLCAALGIELKDREANP